MSNKKGKITNHRRVEIPWNDCKQASPSLSILLSLNILIIYNKQKKKKKKGISNYCNYRVIFFKRNKFYLYCFLYYTLKIWNILSKMYFVITKFD